MLSYLLAQSLNGLGVGIILALIATGLTVIFAILKIVNFAHGELYMVGGYFGYFAIAWLAIPPWAGVPVAMVLSFFFAIAIERSLLTPLYKPTTERKSDYGVLITFGVSIFLRNFAIIVFGPFPLRPPSFWEGASEFGDLVITHDRLFVIAVGILILVALVAFLRYTPWGQALDAVSQSQESAAIVGIDAERAYMLAFGLGGALAGGAGALVGPIFSLSPSMGILPDVQAFVIVILGGMGSIAGSIVGGLGIGLAESLFTALIPDPTRGLSYSTAFGLVIVMIFMLIRPNGIFGRPHSAME